MKRYFVQAIDQEAILDGQQFLHAKRVMRAKIGDELILFNGDGQEYLATIHLIEKTRIICEVQRKIEVDRECTTPVKILLSYLKGDKTELAVQKATELGVHEIAIFSSKFTNAHMNENKLDRLNRVVLESAKQCKRNKIPKVVYHNTLKEALESCAVYENKIFACEFAKNSAINLHNLRGSTAFVVGSEGGFAEEELVLAQNLEFTQLSLGKRILRAETAAIALTSIIIFQLNELE